MSNYRLYFLVLLFSPLWLWSQDFTNIGKAKWLKVNGGISASSVFYEGESTRDPFAYFINGNLNFNIKGVYNIPLSFSYTNQEFETNRPFSFNRLSIHPSYKWITTHIGDVSMTFSPYTLSGHQFTGFGVDLAPDKPFQISAMYGRLLEESEYNESDSQSQPAYKRFGYGIKAAYQFENFDLAVIGFKASDDKNSISNPIPVSFGISPKDNFVASIESNFKIFKKAQIHAEFASSAITEDTNADGEEESASPLSLFIDNNVTTQHYKAFNVDLSYPVANGNVGVGYERIDPDYKTLGAYFFNNDLENITVNASQSILKGKVNIAVNGGLQRDDLENKKQTQLQRIVSSVNLGYTPNEKLNFTGGYSNFQSFTNIKNQFDYINDVAAQDNLDDQEFQQISQNATIGASYQFTNTKQKKSNLNVNFSLQSAVNKQGNETTENGDSNFYNAATTYSHSLPEKNLSIAASANTSYSTIGNENTLTVGPTITVNKQFFDKKVRTTASTSYNQNLNDGEKQSEVLNIRLNGGYVYAKKHNFNLSLLSQFRNSIASNQASDFTATLSYSYSFDKFKFKLPKPKSRDKDNSEVIKFSYRDSLYSGTKSEIVVQLKSLQQSKQFAEIPLNKKEELTILRKIVSDQKKPQEVKEKAINFLKELYSYDDFLKFYNELIYTSFTDLRKQMYDLDYQLEELYTNAQLKVNKHPLHNKKASEISGDQKEAYNEYQGLVKTANNRKSKLIGHRWMEPVVEKLSKPGAVDNPDELLQQFIDNEKYKVYRMYANEPDVKKINLYLVGQLIDYYYKASLKEADQNKVEIRYTNKN